MTMMQLYWMTRLDSICAFFVAVSIIITIIFVIISSVITAISVEEGNEHVPKILKQVWPKLLLCLIFSALMNIFIPTTKEMAFIYVIPKIANSELAQKMGADFVQIEALATDYIKNKLQGTQGKNR